MYDLDLVSAVKSRPFSHLDDEKIATLISDISSHCESKPDYQKFQLQKQSFYGSNLKDKGSILDHFIPKIGYFGSTEHNNPVKNSELVFIIVCVTYESIYRRLGIWQIFDENFAHSKMDPYRIKFNKILEHLNSLPGSMQRIPTTYSDISNFLFREKSKLNPYQILDNDIEIISGILTVNHEYQTLDPNNIGLPAKFYKAVEISTLKNVLEFCPTDEQITAGLHLYNGDVVQMNAGEGKTIAIAFAAILHAIFNHSVHVVTANDYLALRDSSTLSPVYEFLNLKVSPLLESMNREERRHIYGNNIVYSTVKEIGFDFLRDNLSYSLQNKIQKSFDVAIIDEADQILIDESITPLIVSSTKPVSRRGIYKSNSVIQDLISLQQNVITNLVKLTNRNIDTRHKRNITAAIYMGDPQNTTLPTTKTDIRRMKNDAADAIEFEDSSKCFQDLYFHIDLQTSTVKLTDRGQNLVESTLGNVFDITELENELELESKTPIPLRDKRLRINIIRRQIMQRQSLSNQIHQTLKAYLFLENNKDYITTENHVVLIDHLTGRLRIDTNYQFGLHTALEAKEVIPVHGERETAAQISIQTLLKKYDLLSGITGTAISSKYELKNRYDLDVISIEPTTPLRRVDLPSMILNSHEQKLDLILEEVRSCQKVGCPVLIATLTIEHSQEISRILESSKIEHNLLNAVNSSEEEKIIQNAGLYGSITVSTNMAGRGTDILIHQDLKYRIAENYIQIVRDNSNRTIKFICGNSETTQFLHQLMVNEKSAHTITMVDSNLILESEKSTDESTININCRLGLHVIASELNKSKRIDDQLKGRAGRQGEFGSTQFILSREDENFVEPNILSILNSNSSETETKIERIQSIFEKESEIVKSSLEDYYSIIDNQTMKYYDLRTKWMMSDNIYYECHNHAKNIARQMILKHFTLDVTKEYLESFNSLMEEIEVDYGIDGKHMTDMGLREMETELNQLLILRIDEIRNQIDDNQRFDKIAKMVLLNNSDDLWREYISILPETMTSLAIASRNHDESIAQFQNICLDTYNDLIEESGITFLPKLLHTIELESDESYNREIDPSLASKLDEILL